MHGSLKLTEETVDTRGERGVGGGGQAQTFMCGAKQSYSFSFKG